MDDAELAAAPRGVEGARAALRRAASATLYLKHVTQADQGCDFDFLEADVERSATPEPEIH